MSRWAIVTCCAVCLLAVLLVASPAFAAGIAPVDSSVAGEGGYSTPTAGQNPHGGYSATTSKCKVCHAVHGAPPTGEALMRSKVTYPSTKYAPEGLPAGSARCRWCHSISPPIGPYTGHGGWLTPAPPYPANSPYEDNNSEPCVYCHISGPFAIVKVYDGDPMNYYMESTAQDYENNHASSHGLGISIDGKSAYRGCPSCHSVHGANVWSNAADGVSYEKILRTSPGPSMPNAVDNLDDFCRDCHDGTKQNGATGPFCGDMGMSTGCHRTAKYLNGGKYPNIEQVGLITKSSGRNGVSHIMSATTTNSAGLVVAQTGSEHCTSCHKGGDGTAGNSFPHLTSGVDFLADSYVAASHLDQVCLECHDDNLDNGAFGVGDAF